MNKTQQNLAIISLIAAPLFALAATSSDAESGSRCGQDREHEAGRHRGPGMAEHGMHHRLSQLDLTAQQQDQIKQIFDQQKPAREEKMHAMRGSMMALKKATQADAYDHNQVQEIANQQAKLQADLIMLRADTRHQVYAVLTPEQRQKWEDQRQKWEEHGWYKNPGNAG